MNKKDCEETVREIRGLLFAHAFKDITATSTLSDNDGERLVDLFISKTIRFAIHEDGEVDRWIKQRLRSAGMRSEITPLDALDQWVIDAETGNIAHSSGRFYSILGLTVRHRIKHDELVWDQPIIDQPEFGILGILARKFHGVLHFCLQAKEEPGNIHSVQLSPTVQATYSNYTRTHGGKLPPFLELFLDPPKERILFAKLQSEDGGRFLFKSNRNMIVIADEEITTPPDGYIWLTLRQISDLMRRDNMVNACTRSVLAAVI
jgi:oxidase EvaA